MAIYIYMAYSKDLMGHRIEAESPEQALERLGELDPIYGYRFHNLVDGLPQPYQEPSRNSFEFNDRTRKRQENDMGYGATYSKD